MRLDTFECRSNRLVDVLFIHAVRSFLDESAETGDCGWLAAIRDQQIGRALAAIHRDPHRSWTVESLARHVAMSRTTFAAKFRDLVGEPPQHYFTRLRISAAAVRLRSSRDKLNAVAADAGYRPLAAFLRSFKRHMGITPGSIATGVTMGRSKGQASEYLIRLNPGL